MNQLPLSLPPSLPEQIDAARQRVHARIEIMVEAAHAERKAMMRSASARINRCVGQRIRRQRERVTNRTPLPAVFRNNRR